MLKDVKSVVTFHNWFLKQVYLQNLSNEPKYKIICWNCKWEDGEYKDNSRTGLCKTPESALRIWNNKFGRED